MKFSIAVGTSFALFRHKWRYRIASSWIIIHSTCPCSPFNVTTLCSIFIWIMTKPSSDAHMCDLNWQLPLTYWMSRVDMTETNSRTNRNVDITCVFWKSLRDKFYFHFFSFSKPRSIHKKVLAHLIIAIKFVKRNTVTVTSCKRKSIRQHPSYA